MAQPGHGTKLYLSDGRHDHQSKRRLSPDRRRPELASTALEPDLRRCRVWRAQSARCVTRLTESKEGAQTSKSSCNSSSHFLGGLMTSLLRSGLTALVCIGLTHYASTSVADPDNARPEGPRFKLFGNAALTA